MTLDMTRGKPLGCMLRFALPLVISSLLQQMYTLCDSVIVGRLLGTLAFTATGSAAYLNWFLLSMVTGATHGFGVPLSQRFGAKQEEAFRRFLGCALVLSLIIGIVFSLGGVLLIEELLAMIHTPVELMALTARYTRVLWAGFWITALMNMFTSALMAMGDSRTPLTALAISSFVNIVLDLIFIGRLQLDVEGAALATLIAQFCAALWSFRGLIRVRQLMPRRQDFRMRRDVLQELLRMGVPRVISGAVISSGEMLVQAAINSCGVIFVTGMTAARRYFNLVNVIGGALEGSLITFVGQNYGAGEHDRIVRGTRSAVTLGFTTSVATGALVWLLAEPMIRFFVPDGSGEVIRVGILALRIQAVFLWSLYLLCEFRASIQGMGNVLIPTLSGFLELVLRIVCALGLPLLIGKEGLYFTDIAAWVPTMTMLIISYYRLKKKLLS